MFRVLAKGMDRAVGIVGRHHYRAMDIEKDLISPQYSLMPSLPNHSTLFLNVLYVHAL